MKTLITPSRANLILAKNNMNRSIVKANLSFLEDELKSGRFTYNGESIIISNKGNLLDGQHRLMAIQNTGISAEINLVEGVEESVMSTIDTGATRTTASVFSLYNIASSRNMAAMCKKIMEKQGLNRKINRNGNIKLSNQETVDFYFYRKDILSSIYSYCVSLYNKDIKVIAPSEAGAYMYLLGQEDKRAKEFITEVMTGEHNTESNYARLLRNRLINDKISTVKLSSAKKRDFIIFAFRGYLRGATVKKINASIAQTFIDIDPKEGKVLFEI